jgi:hypothetical protein
MRDRLGEALAPWRPVERDGDTLRVQVRHTLAARDRLDPVHLALGAGELAAERYAVRLVLVNDANTPRDVQVWAVPATGAPEQLARPRCVPHSETEAELALSGPGPLALVIEPEEL